MLAFAFTLQVVAVALLFAVIEESALFLMKKGELDRAIIVFEKINYLNTGSRNLG